MTPSPDPIATTPIGMMRTRASDRIAMRSANRPGFGAAFIGRVVAFIAVSVMTVSIIAVRFGGFAAAGEESATATDAAPPSLAGRWIGKNYGFSRADDEKGCDDDGCRLAYDIVACKDGWCGITLNADNSCGDVGLHLAADTESDRHVFKGRVELAKRTAPYSVQVWLNSDKDASLPELHLIGATDLKFLLMRRSFPFEARLARSGDAVCALPKTTS